MVKDTHENKGASLPYRIAYAIAMLLLAFVLGLVVALIIRAVLYALSLCEHLIWVDAPTAMDIAWLSLLVCPLGGLVIGLWTKHCGGSPEPLGKVIGSVRNTGGYRVKSIPSSVVGFALPVVFGGCVGPCAGVVGIIASLCTAIGDLLKRAGLRLHDADDVSVSAALTAVLGAPFAGIVAGDEASPERARKSSLSRGARIVLYAAASGGALCGMLLFKLVMGPGGGGGLPRLESTGFTVDDLPWMLVCFAAAWALSLVFTGSIKLFGRLSRLLDRHPLVRTTICGTVIGIVGAVFPFALFSGEAQVDQIAANWQAMPALMLLVGAVAKAVLTPLCLQFGWGGGPLFPCVFTGVSLGYGIAGLAGVDPVCCAAVASGAFVACSMRRPLLAAALVILCFPPQSIVWLLLAAFVAGRLPMPKLKDSASQ